MIPRYFEWDYDNDLVVEYERDGECNGCGACCTTLIRWQGQNRGMGQPNPILGWHPANGEFTTDPSGCVNEVQINGKRRFFRNIEIVAGEQNRCPSLTEGNRCAIHLGKMLLHRAWPLSPRHVTPFPDCSYSFREVWRRKISEPEVMPA